MEPAAGEACLERAGALPLEFDLGSGAGALAGVGDEFVEDGEAAGGNEGDLKVVETGVEQAAGELEAVPAVFGVKVGFPAAFGSIFLQDALGEGVCGGGGAVGAGDLEAYFGIGIAPFDADFRKPFG